MPDISIVVPVFNESGIIQELIKRIKLNVVRISKDYEIIIVDDGSLDSTWDEILNESKQEVRVKGIKLSRNFGHHNALTAGINHASGEWVIIMDGDLQDRPEVIPELYQKTKEGFDVVFVSRQNRPEKFYYIAIQKIFYLILRNLSGVKFNSKQANFSIINKKVVEAYKQFPEAARFYASTIYWLGFSRSEIIADHGTRFNGKPSYTFRKRIRLAYEIIVTFSERVLQAAIIIASFASLSSILLSLKIVMRGFGSGNAIETMVILATVSLILLGILIFLFGIIGLYIGQIFIQVKNRPLYVVDSLTFKSN
jgi:glycosyltransferase involved in cell wall biosynthesis